VRAFEQHPDHNLVLFSHDVLDTDLKVGEGTAKVTNKRLQLPWAANFYYPVTKPVCNPTLREQFVYRCLSAFVRSVQ
jgi:hypothetical protein